MRSFTIKENHIGSVVKHTFRQTHILLSFYEVDLYLPNGGVNMKRMGITAFMIAVS